MQGRLAWLGCGSVYAGRSKRNLLWSGHRRAGSLPASQLEGRFALTRSWEKCQRTWFSSRCDCKAADWMSQSRPLLAWTNVGGHKLAKLASVRSPPGSHPSGTPAPDPGRFRGQRAWKCRAHALTLTGRKSPSVGAAQHDFGRSAGRSAARSLARRDSGSGWLGLGGPCSGRAVGGQLTAWTEQFQALAGIRPTHAAGPSRPIGTHAPPEPNPAPGRGSARPQRLTLRFRTSDHSCAADLQIAPVSLSQRPPFTCAITRRPSATGRQR